MQDKTSLAGRVIMITGAGQGIGRALAEYAAAKGARVALVDINQQLLSETVELIGEEHARAYVGDITNESFVQSTVNNIVDDFGDLHGLINNAGIVRAAMVHKMTLAQWQQVIDVNLTGAFICLQAVGKYLIHKANSGDPNPGSIVNVSSDAGRRGTVGQINYGAAKSGVLGLTMSAAREWGVYNINVNSVCFGMVETAMTETVRQEKFREKYLRQIPLGRFSTPEDVAPATCMLLSDMASYITGQHLSISGGFHIGA
ncbi:SDR family NAD(P)-dependent oxidoreductase [Zhongshania aquimaris]|uniref:SDR family oxidoreductase n=1 Tax=Zhongshania aquimaris TaxID=2857107 RepID=A0ABS6VTK5_9GAMM|nr:SDR family NAD(P)-dependent oxidoreductase [Zhongshania aquimaris]MBW2941354.1 SDR family oxidoreductase [Zhongshania aquimaris]